MIPTPPMTAPAMVALSPTLRPVEVGESAGELDVGEELTEFVEAVNIGFVGVFATVLGKEAVVVAGLEEVGMYEEADVEELVGKSTTSV
jgi:hypothetical protein